MRAFRETLTFELRLQCRTPLFAGTLLLFFVIHLLTMSQAGIHLGDNELVHINSPYQIFQTQLVLGIFGMLPAMIFVVNAIVRDYDRRTIELFFTTPVGTLPWLLGRFSGGTLCAVSAGVAGLLGTLAGSFMPWIEQTRLGSFDAVPYVASFVSIDLPNLLIFCTITFSVAALTRSQAWAFAVALAFVVLELLVHNATAAGAPAWLQLVDPFGGLSITEVTRYWTVGELNTRLPLTTLVLANRTLWIGIALSTLAVTLARLRLELPQQTGGRLFRARLRQSHSRAAAVPAADATPRFAVPDQLGQFASQLRIDLRSVVLSPLFGLIALFAAVSTISEFQANTDGIMGLPLHPLTGLMLGFFRFGLFQFVLIVVTFYSATLVHREREHGLAEMIGASPYPDWLMPVSKTATLLAAVTLLLIVSMMTCIILQLLAGHGALDLGVYVQGLFVYNGFYFGMLGVLAVVVQVFSPGKWSGMLLLFSLLIALLSMEPLGLEHVLYGFRIPYVVYSDMNGFGHFRQLTWALILYWGLFCVLLLIVGHLLFPRGTATEVRERLRDARTRMTPAVAMTTGVVVLLWAASGGWIYWNTNVLNAYTTADSRLRAQAAYEKQYGGWKNRPTPVFSDITMEVELYPEERRLESRGRATLTNRKDVPIAAFAVSTDPRLRVTRLTVEHASLEQADPALGFRVFHLEHPLRPGDSIAMDWTATRENRGFVNSDPDNEIVANGTFVDLLSIAPLPAYDEERELTDPGQRRRVGLRAAARLPTLGDPDWRNTLGFGVDGRMTFRVIFSTAADQTAVSAGVLEREWTDAGRRYFEYAMEHPIWPRVSFSSARYAVAHDTWNGVSLDVYHDVKHPWNVPIMLATAKKAMEYFSREYAPYPLSSFRILEYPRYRTAARAYPGTVAYSESAGFLTDLSGWASLDYATAHELAHQWWGGLIYGAKMQGRQMLNETMAQYSTLMVFRQEADPQWLRRVLAATHRNYLDARSRENVGEQPLMYTEDQGNISYNKGALVMFALQDLIGADRMHQALRSFLRRFAMQPPPYPMSRDLVDELRAAAGPEYQQLITDMFERIVLYDVSPTAADVTAVDGEYEVAMSISARQFEADAQGVEHEVPLDTSFDLVVFPESSAELVARTPIYQHKHRLQSGTQRIVVRVPTRPAAVGVDPFHLMIDQAPENNVLALAPGDYHDRPGHIASR